PTPCLIIMITCTQIRQIIMRISPQINVQRNSNALRYLSRYVFKTATDNRWLPVVPDGRLRWGYRDSQSGKSASLRLEPLELIRRFLQHILPAGFHRVRRFGWLHPARRVQLNRVRGLLRKPALLSAAQRAAWQPPGSDFEPPEPLPAPDHRPLCLKCQRPMIRVGRWLKGQPPPDPPARAPPGS
ncbi:MAG: transposase, partial [Armatimonadota bacterium]